MSRFQGEAGGAHVVERPLVRSSEDNNSRELFTQIAERIVAKDVSDREYISVDVATFAILANVSVYEAHTALSFFGIGAVFGSPWSGNAYVSIKK